MVRAAGGIVWRPGPGGVRVLLVHRPEYDDWTFPKGKVEPGETDEACATREIEEETGVLCALGPELPTIRYRDGRGRPKVVRYWAARPRAGRARPRNEVDGVRWAPVAEAAARLSYPRDRELLASFLAAGVAPASAPDGDRSPSGRRSAPGPRAAGRRPRTPDALAVGSRVAARAPSAADARGFLAAVRASRALHRPWVAPPADPAAFRGYLLRAHRPDFQAFLLCRREDGALAGVVNLSQIFRGDFRSAYLGYYAFAPLAGQGYLTEGLALVVRHAFRTLGLHRVEANLQPGNTASRRLVQRLGFRREGFSRRYLKIGGRWRDHERWALAADDRVGRTRIREAIRGRRVVR